MAEKRLTKEIAEQFLADEYSVDLSTFTELDDDAAESLSKHEGDLSLYGLTEPVGRGSREPQQARGRALPQWPDEPVRRGGRESQ